MSGSGDSLARRRVLLIARSGVQRQLLATRLGDITGGFDRLDRGLDSLARLASPPLVVGGAALLLFILGRNRTRRIVAGGLALAMATRRAQATGSLIAYLLARVVNRSAGPHSPGYRRDREERTRPT